MKKYLSLFIALLTVFAIGRTAFAAAPILHYSFDEGNGTSISAVIGSSTGVLSGGIGWASGKVGNAVGFKGDAGQSIGLGSTILPAATEGSVAVWVKPEAQTDRNIIFALRDAGDNTKYFALALDRDNRPIVRYRAGSGQSERITQGSKVLDPNTWYQIVFTANTQRYFIYLNGEILDVSGDNSGKWLTDTFSGPMNYTAGSLDSSGISGSFTGMIDDLRVYGHALTQEEVTALYNETNAGVPTTPLVALPQITMTISETVIPSNGSVKVMWSVSNANTCTSSWNAPIGLSGDAVFTNITEGRDFGVSCTKTGGASASASVSVAIQGTATGTPQVPVTPSPVPTGKGPVLARTLSVGSRGADVTTLQQYLITKGFLAPSYATGYFGVLTQASVKAFQKASGIDQVGIAGPLTRAKIQTLP